MMSKKRFKIFNFILCLAITAFMIPIEALALDNPKNGYIEEFPAPGSTDTVISENLGTINYAKSGGRIIYNHNYINNLEGATVDENRDGATIVNFGNGRVENNYGTIEKVNNSASVGTNTLYGVIKENFNNVEKNVGKINYQYSGTITENYGDVDTIGQSATIEKLYGGTINENSGNVTIYPAPEGIETEVKIISNKKSVKIQADTDNKSSVTIEKNEEGATLYVCEGADCTVKTNAGKIEVEKGGNCTINTNTETAVVDDKNKNPEENYDYELILKNVDSSEISFVDFFKEVDGKIYVMGEGRDSNLIVTYDKDRFFYRDAIEVSGYMAIPIENLEYSQLNSEEKTFTIHIHTKGEFVHSSAGKHCAKCIEEWNGGECPATSAEEACSYSWIYENGNHKQVCTKCGDIANAGKCSYGEWIVDSEAKVGVAGKKHRVCSMCKGVENATIPAITDNGNKKADEEPSGNEPGGKGQDINPTKEDTAPIKNPIKADTVSTPKAAKADTASTPKAAKADTAQVENLTKTDAASAENSINKNSDQKVNSQSENETVQKEAGVDSGFDEENNKDSKLSEPAMVGIEGFENKGTVSSSSNFKIGIIAGSSVFAVAAVTACFFVRSRKSRRKKHVRK